MVIFLGMLLFGTCFFGLCTFNLTRKGYEFVVGIGDAYDLNMVEWVILVLGTFLAGALTLLCGLGSIALGDRLL